MASKLGNWNKLREPRLGVMLHFDDSSSDEGAQTWLMRDPACHVSYNWLVLDDGALVEVAPEGARAWHAGVCKPSRPELRYADANSALYGIAIAAADRQHATEAQVRAVVTLCKRLAILHGWDYAKESWRITTHSAEAAPRGRKIDPEGSGKLPVLDVREVRRRAAAA